MQARFRPARSDDLAWCASILRDGFESKPGLHAQLPSLWGRLIAGNALMMSVLVDAEASNRLIAFGATAFLSDSFVRKALAQPTPYLAVNVLEREVEKRRRVILQPDAVRRQSIKAEGLNLCILHYSEVLPEYNEDQRLMARNMMVQGLLETHARYSLKSLLYEIFGEEDCQYILDSGAPLISDFVDWFAEQKLPLPEPSQRPLFFALERASARKRQAAWMSWLFLTCPARAGLSPAEQRVLIRSLAGETDSQLAHNPEISPSTVRKHWRFIYRKFRSAKIELVSDETTSLPLSDREGFKKKRQFLLNYLRQHPEELRPKAGQDLIAKY